MRNYDHAININNLINFDEWTKDPTIPLCKRGLIKELPNISKETGVCENTSTGETNA